MDHFPLVKELIVAGEKLIRAFDRVRPIKVAFWMKESDDPYRYLYMASDQFREIGVRQAYSDLADVFFRLAPEELDPTRFKVIYGDSPLAEAALDRLEYPGAKNGIRFETTWFCDQMVDDLYVYPRLTAEVS